MSFIWLYFLVRIFLQWMIMPGLMWPESLMIFWLKETFNDIGLHVASIRISTEHGSDVLVRLLRNRQPESILDLRAWKCWSKTHPFIVRKDVRKFRLTCNFCFHLVYHQVHSCSIINKNQDNRANIIPEKWLKNMQNWKCSLELNLNFFHCPFFVQEYIFNKNKLVVRANLFMHVSDGVIYQRPLIG